MYAISPIKFYNPSFGVYFNNVNDEEGKIRYRGDTRICRDDLYFPEVVDFLDNKYKNVPKVNVVMHACSDGEEVYSFLGVLVARLMDKSEKFLPVKAKDIDENHLKLAKRGVYHVSDTEYTIANDNMNRCFYHFFDYLPHKESPDPRLKYTKTVKANDLLKSLVSFEQGNILEDVNRIEFKNTVLFARNFWPYLSSKEQNGLAKILSKKMDESSTLIIGDYDREAANLDALLRKYGFEETKAENVFEKRKTLVYN